MILVAILYALLASTFVLAKNALSYGKPFFLIGFRMTLAGGLLIGFEFLRGRLSLKKEDLWLFFRVALFHIYFSFILEFWALQYLSAFKTTLIYSSTPFIAALLSYVLLKERLGLTKVVGVIVGLLGMVPIFVVTMDASVVSITLPDVVLFGAVISGAYAWFLVKELLNKGYSFFIINGVAMLIGGILSLGTSFVIEGYQGLVSDVPQFLFWVGSLILVSNIVVYNLYGWLLKRYSITFLTFAGFLCPGFAGLYQWILTGEPMGWHNIASLVLVTIGLSIFYSQELRRKKVR